MLVMTKHWNRKQLFSLLTLPKYGEVSSEAANFAVELTAAPSDLAPELSTFTIALTKSERQLK